MKKILIFYSFLFTLSFSASAIGMVTKTMGNVEYKESSSGSTKQLVLGNFLYNNDQIITKEDGFAVILYIDDKSQVKIQSNTELTIRGTASAGEIAKQINVTNGIVKANVTKEQSSDFTLVSPTSVAAVKGTDFWGVIDENTGDKFCGLSGKVEVTNSATGQMVELVANTTALSLKDGSLSVAVTQEGDIPADEDPDGDDNGEKEIRIPYQNEAGEQKELIIKIKNN
tara:strand:- start:336 stop:1016 length:681 start_codon:yes stop_codon:yes gene_type:complete